MEQVVNDKVEDEIPKDVVDDLRVTKVPCPKCASHTVIFADTKPKIEEYQGALTVTDYMRCLSCSALYTQYYY